MSAQPQIVPIRFLLVEDNPADARLFVETLREASLENAVVVADNGIDAMKCLYGEGRYEGEPRPGLVFLDLNLPGKDGREVLQEIKAEPSLRAIPVVVLTNSYYEKDLLQACDLHAAAYVIKPPRVRTLLSALRAVPHYRLVVIEYQDADQKLWAGAIHEHSVG